MKQALLGVVLITTCWQFSSSAHGQGLSPDPMGNCHAEADFTSWRTNVLSDAQAAGIKPGVINLAKPYLDYDPTIQAKDSNQAVFNETWLKFSDSRVTARLKESAKAIQQNSELFDRVEADYGVPREVLVAFWALESDIGAAKQKSNILSAVTTLAWNCRRADFFRKQLLAALQIIQNGDQTPTTMIGSWAGEFGPMQITPSDYVQYAVDYDGDGRRDLIGSTSDVVASAANFLKVKGKWQAGQRWMDEVRVPMDMAWEQADMAVSLPRSEWIKQGIVGTSRKLANDGMLASLYLPMGRMGPAFLLYDNFKNGFMGWNDSLVYSSTVAYLANRIAAFVATGNPNSGLVYRGNNPNQVVALSVDDMKELQRQLKLHDFGDNVVDDGKMGTATRTACRKAQLKLGLPPDAYPTAELLQALKD